MELIDIGANLTHASFRTDLPEVITRARANHLTQIVVTGTSVAESQQARALAEEYPGFLHSTAGVHPHDASDWNESTLNQLTALAELPEVVAIGETGLDFNRDFSPRAVQEKVFEAQLDLAASLNMPVFMHERDASEHFSRILSRYRDRLDKAVIHCFTGNAEELAVYLDLDMHIGITGWICDERRGLHLRDLLKHIPLQRLMLETDAPYLLPRNMQPKPKNRRNEPAYLTNILNIVAECLELPEETIAAKTTQTAQQFFTI